MCVGRPRPERLFSTENTLTRAIAKAMTDPGDDQQGDALRCKEAALRVIMDVTAKGASQTDSGWLELKQLLAASPRVQEHSLVGCGEGHKVTST